MKKITFFLFALCAFSLSVNATDYYYLAAVTSVTIDSTLSTSTKNVFKVIFEQTCKRTDQYDEATVYKSTGEIVLNSDDRTLEGTYTTEGAHPTSTSANVNDQTISLVYSSYTIGSTSRKLDPDKISTFTIHKIGEKTYSIGIGELHFKSINGQYTYNFSYCYDEDEINTEGISPKAFVFGYSPEYVADVYNYDLTVNDLDIVYNKTDYDAHRYFLTLGCSGKCRETNDERNYEVQLAIYPSEMNIVGSYATQGSGNPLMALYSYVKDLKITKTRYLANDSISSISIVSTGENKYNFTGGPLICTDVDLNHQAVYGKKRIEAVHYYYFNYAGNQGIDFNFDGTTASLIDPVSTGIDNTSSPSEEGRGEALKLFRDGQLIIERNGVFYNMQGVVIR